MSTPCEEIRPDLEALLAAMAEGQLDAQGARKLSLILKEHPDARQFYLDYCQIHALLQSAHGVLQAMGHPAGGRRRVLAWTAAAAAVLAVAGAAFYVAAPAPIDASASILQGSATVLRDDRRFPLAEIREMRAGDRIVTPAAGTAEVRYGDGSRVVLLERSEVRLRDDGRARLELREGGLRCDVTPQPAGRPFAISTPHGEATVLGTSFDLEATSEETRLATRSGRVRLSAERQSVEVGPGELGTAGASGAVRWVPVRDFDFSSLRELPSTWETLFCEASVHLHKERKIERVSGRALLVPGGLTFVQGPPAPVKHGLVVLKDKEDLGEDLILEAVVAGGRPWSLQFSVSGDAFEGYRVVFAAMDEYPTGVAIDTISAGELMVLARDPRKIPYGTDRTVRVERHGSRIRALVDGRTRIDTEISQPLPEGRRRTYSVANYGAEPVVKSLKVWKPAP